MKIEVDLFADLRKFADPPSFEIDIPSGSTIRDLLPQIGIPEGFSLLVVVNEVMASHDREIRDGDKIGLFPPMGGGEETVPDRVQDKEWRNK